jgi:hypothetical protein
MGWGGGDRGLEGPEVGEERGDDSEDDILSHVKVWAHGRKQKLEPQLSSLAVFNPATIPDYDFKVEIGRDLLLDDVPKGEGGKGYVSVSEWSFVWQEGQGLGAKTFEGLTTWGGKDMDYHERHLEPSEGDVPGKARGQSWCHRELRLVFEEKKHQEKLEEAGYRSPTWSLLRALQSVNGAKRL